MPGAALTLLLRLLQITALPPKSKTLTTPLSTPRRPAYSLSAGLESSVQAHNGDVTTQETRLVAGDRPGGNGAGAQSIPRPDPDVFGMSDYDLAQYRGQERLLPPSPPNNIPAAAEDSCPQNPDPANCRLVLPPFLVDGPSGGSHFDVGLRLSKFLTVGSEACCEHT